MKKGVLIAVAFLILALFPLITADVNNTAANNGFSCLSNKTLGQCGGLSLGQQIFTSLANGLCTDYVANSSDHNGCYEGNLGTCDIKTTAQAILALNQGGISANKSLSWLISQNKSTSDITWYLQVDSNQATTCTLSYSNNINTITLGADKKIQGDPGNCFSISSDGYWLAVKQSCFGVPIVTSCDQSFTTAKLYQRSPTSQYPSVYVSDSLQTSSSGGKITNSFSSYCFGTSSCDYESTLWASLILDRLGYDVSPYLSYLTAEASDSSNAQYLPYAFLYSLTSSPDYLTDLLAAQKTVNGQKYWDYQSDSYFGTSLALLAIKSTDTSDSNNAINWLLSVQGKDGCWNNDNILNTAFVLYSAFGSKETSGGSQASQICSDVGYCISSLSCNQVGGSVFSSYNPSCPGLQICCSKNVPSQTCADQGDQLCDSGQVCSGSTLGSSDSTSDRVCCSGNCITPSSSASSTCDSVGGICRNSCFSNEGVSSGAVCSSGSQVCCVQSISSAQSPNRTLWIILLSVLIVLALLAIIFRKKLAPLWLRIKSKFGKGRGSARPSGPGPRPPFSPGPSSSSFQRRPMLSAYRRPVVAAKPVQKPSSEVNEVLKKLKEMGK